MARRPKDVAVPVAHFEGEEDVDPFKVIAQSTWKKSTASMVGGLCARRDRRQLVWVSRSGAGGIRRFQRNRLIVEHRRDG